MVLFVWIDRGNLSLSDWSQGYRQIYCQKNNIEVDHNISILHKHHNFCTNLHSMEKNVTDGILEGDAGSIAMLLHTSCGVEENISLGLVGMLLQDKMVVINSIYELSEEHGLDGDFNILIAEIAFNEYNPDSQGINQVSSTIILSIKKLISKVFPQFPNDTIDGILQVVFEADPRPIENIAKSLQIPQSLFKIFIGIAFEDEK